MVGHWPIPRSIGRAEGQASGSIITGLFMGHEAVERDEMANQGSQLNLMEKGAQKGLDSGHPQLGPKKSQRTHK